MLASCRAFASRDPADYKRRARRIAILGIVLVVHVIPLTMAIANPERAYTAGDSEAWDTLARNLLLHRSFSLKAEPPFEPNVFRTPAYPALIAAVYATTNFDLRAVLAAQAIFGALCAVLVFELGIAIGLPIATSEIGAVLSTFLPISTVFWATLASENLFVLCMLVALVLVWQIRDPVSLIAVAVGIVAGLMVLARPIGVLLLPVLALAMIWKRTAGQAMLRLGCSIVGFALVLAPWWWRNYSLFGKPALSTVGGVNLLTYNAAAVLTHRAGLGFWEGRHLIWEYWDRYYETLEPKPSNPVEDAEAMRAAATQIISEQPLFSIWVNIVEGANSLRPGVSQFMLFLQPDAFTDISSYDKEVSPATYSLSRPVVLIVTLALTVFYAVVFAAFAVGAGIILWRREWRAALTLLAPATILMLAPGPVASSRFRVPAEPLIALVVAHAIWYTYQAWKARRARTQDL